MAAVLCSYFFYHPCQKQQKISLKSIHPRSERPRKSLGNNVGSRQVPRLRRYGLVGIVSKTRRPSAAMQGCTFPDGGLCGLIVAPEKRHYDSDGKSSGNEKTLLDLREEVA